MRVCPNDIFESEPYGLLKKDNVDIRIYSFLIVTLTSLPNVWEKT